jgi:hypothetical protein
MVCAGSFFARRAGQPDRTKLPLIAPLPALLLLALGASTDTSGLPVTGNSGICRCNFGGVVAGVGGDPRRAPKPRADPSGRRRRYCRITLGSRRGHRIYARLQE